MTLSIFYEWLQKINKKMEQQGRRILLLLDNAPVHPCDVELSNIELMYFPPNVTSKLQPLDQGIIKAFKDHYKKKLNEMINFSLDCDENRTYNDLIKGFKLYDSIKLILEAWNNVSRITVINCFKKAISNASLSIDQLFCETNNNETELNGIICYQNNLEDEVLFQEIEIELAKIDIEANEKKETDEDDVSDMSNDNVQIAATGSRTYTHLEAKIAINNIEDYMLRYHSNDLESFYLFKKVFNKQTGDEKNSIFNFLERKNK